MANFSTSNLPSFGIVGQIHGRVGNFVFSVRNGLQRVHLYQKQQRTKAPTPAEIQSRARFMQANEITRQLLQNGDLRHRNVIFREVYQKLKNESFS